MSIETEDAFQKELVELFVQEAQEWLRQIHVALDELQQSPPSDRHRALVQTIKVGITNLGGSAATLNLSEVERASFSAFPFVEAVQDPSAKVSSDDFIALCKQLGHIHGALTRATGVSFDADHAPDAIEELPTMISTKEFLVRLRALRDQHRGSDTSTRNLAHTIVIQAEGMIERGVDQCNVGSILEFLDRSTEGDQGFLQLVRQEYPQLTSVIHTLKNVQVAQSPLPSDVPHAAERAAQVWSAAQQVNASGAMSFFMGLHSFLTIVMGQRVAVRATTYDAVQLRLEQSVKSIEEWVQCGETERSEIRGLLPH